MVDKLIKDIDWIITYRNDSDIFHPYGSVEKCTRKWNGTDNFDKKTKLVAWVVSNCNTGSRREDLVAILDDFITVDIYGKCGTFDCPRGPDCPNTIGRDYKFYLSFENSVSL